MSGRRSLTLVLAALLSCPAAPALFGNDLVRISVFGLFQPTELTVRPMPGQILVIQADTAALTLEGAQAAHFRLVRGQVEWRVESRSHSAAVISIVSRSGPADFRLAVPGKIDRRFEGNLEIAAAGEVLRAVVAMERQTAVASIVAAESPPGAPLAALAAQAVVTRSYLEAAAGRHAKLDFCDTTHCQYLRQPPPAGHPAWLAAEATRGLILTYRSRAIAAMYSSRCGGSTHSLSDVGLSPGVYPFYAVECRACRLQPEKWVRSFGNSQARQFLPNVRTEAARLQIARLYGWNTLPSNSYRVEQNGAGVTLHGTGSGHGVGLCQAGAAAMAASGAGFRQILRHYFPNTALEVRGP